VWENTVLNSDYRYLNRNSERNSEPPLLLHRFIVLSMGAATAVVVIVATVLIVAVAATDIGIITVVMKSY